MLMTRTSHGKTSSIFDSKSLVEKSKNENQRIAGITYSPMTTAWLETTTAKVQKLSENWSIQPSL